MACYHSLVVLALVKWLVWHALVLFSFQSLRVIVIALNSAASLMVHLDLCIPGRRWFLIAELVRL